MWNTYITDIYWPSNTSADAPEKILYFFIRDGLVKTERKNDKIFQYKNNKWFDDLLDSLKFETTDEVTRNKFKEYYTVTLQEGNTGSYKSALPVPFHVLIPAFYQPITSNDQNMSNRGFSNRFLLTFFWDGQKLNYDLIKKLWEVFNTNQLNYYEKLIVEAIDQQSNFSPQLKSEEELNSYIRNWNISKFACKHQPLLFQKDLEYVLGLKTVSRVEKIRWIEYLIYFHFSTYMLRIYSIIENEFEEYEEGKDNCLSCNGDYQCPFKGKINVKSNLSGHNKEAKLIQHQYNQLMNFTLIKGYVRFLVISRIFDIYSSDKVAGKEAENLLEVKEYLQNSDNKNKFILAINRFLKDSVYPAIKEYSSYEESEVFINPILNTKEILFKLFDIYLDFYERKGIKSLDNSTKQVFNKLAGDKMGCNYLHIQKNNANLFQFNSEFLSFIVNVILGSNGEEQILLTELWERLSERGFSIVSKKEKDLIEKQLTSMGLLEKKSDAGESEFVKRTIR